MLASVAGAQLGLRAPAPVRAGRAGPVAVAASQSRIGKQPVKIPSGVTVKVDKGVVGVKGPKGELTMPYEEDVTIELTDNVLRVKPMKDTKRARQMHGLYRALAANMVKGVTQGFTRELRLVGVGYRAQVQGTKLQFTLGLSHPVEVEIPKGMTVKVDKQTDLSVWGLDKCAVGTFCAELRRLRPPEPYGGKGIRYADEEIKLKEGKKGK